MVRETVLATVITGLIAALALTVMQALWVTPLILQAETFEHAESLDDRNSFEHAQSLRDHNSFEHAQSLEHRASFEHAESLEHRDSSAHADSLEHHQHHELIEHHEPAHHHQHEDAAPSAQRTALTFGANLLMSIGYACILAAVYLLWRQPQKPVWGLAYGVAGFIVFFAAPALGLPPELPGTAAAEITLRQQWWILIAATTGGGLLLLFSQVAGWVRAAGALLMVAPHFIPAPTPDVYTSLAPEALQAQFRLATTATNAVFWLLLGLTSAVAMKKLR